MKHLLITRLWFDSKELLDKYLDVSVNTLIPAIKSQTCKDFEFGLLIRECHVEHVKNRIGVDFTAFTGGIFQLRKEVLEKQWNIQSRLDIDDWVSPKYIEEIQRIYNQNKDEYNDFIIHAQPIKLDWDSNTVLPIAKYHDQRISMFATLCQNDPYNAVYKGSHGQLYQLGEKVFKMPDGMAKWVQHKNSVTRTKKGRDVVGNMRLSDKSHNWISEEPTLNALNVLTRTFKRPNSFMACKESVDSQTYANINHIVGSEVECDYHKAIKLTVKTGRYLPWNLHLNDLAKEVKSGWVMYLDDDDKFLFPDAAKEIMREATDKNTMLLWRVKIGANLVPSDQYFGKQIKRGQISGIGVAFHCSHLPVPWLDIKCGDHHIINELSKKLKVKWIDKTLTGIQGKRNHHGGVPDIENKVIEMKTNDIQKGFVSIGTPTWNNKNIFWLSIESLCRQKTSYKWEYIVHECPSDNEVGIKGINEYKSRLEKAGCIRIIYINNGVRVDLSTKWKQIADKATGEVLILHDSDDYTHPLRIQKTMDLIGDKPWYDTRFAWHYLLKRGPLIIYDYMAVGSWKTGFNIAIRTELLRSIPDNHKNKGMHTWMMGYINDRYVDENNYACFATTGVNTVSLNRKRHFYNPRGPFFSTDKTIRDIGIPDDIIERLEKVDLVSDLTVHRNMHKVEVEFLKDYCRLYKTGDIKKIPINAYYDLSRKGHVVLTSQVITKPICVEI